MTDSEANTNPRVSDKFCSEDAEIRFKSFDGVGFRIHSDNLKACSGVLSPPGNVTFDEVVSLTEPAEILDLLFQFIYPQPYPDLGSIDFDVLEQLTEAAEKYQVYSAMNLCRVHMMDVIPGHEISVFSYALKHGHPDIASRVAPLILDHPLEKVLSTIPPIFFIPWAKYYDEWREITHRNNGKAKELSSFANPTSTVCAKLTKIPIFHGISPPTTETDFPHKVVGVRSDATSVQEENMVFYQASDNFIFSINRLHILAYSSALPMPPSSRDSPIPLSDSSSSLKLLFDFMAPNRLPNLSSLSFNILEPLSIAAEKYRVYPAMSACRFYMMKNLPEHPRSIFIYAAKAGYDEILTQVAPLVIDVPLEDMVSNLPQHLVVPWVRYYRKWEDVIRSAFSYHTRLPVTSEKNMRLYPSYMGGTTISTDVRACPGCNKPADLATMKILVTFGEGTRSLKNLDKTFSGPSCCVTRGNDVRAWRSFVEDEIRKIPPFLKQS